MPTKLKYITLIVFIFCIGRNERRIDNMQNARVIINNGKDTILFDKYGVSLNKVHSTCDIKNIMDTSDGVVDIVIEPVIDSVFVYKKNN